MTRKVVRNILPGHILPSGLNSYFDCSYDVVVAFSLVAFAYVAAAGASKNKVLSTNQIIGNKIWWTNIESEYM